MDALNTNQFVTVGDIARELGDTPKRVAAVLYSQNIREMGRVGNARIFDRDLVLPRVRIALERSRYRQRRPNEHLA